MCCIISTNLFYPKVDIKKSIFFFIFCTVVWWIHEECLPFAPILFSLGNNCTCTCITWPTTYTCAWIAKSFIESGSTTRVQCKSWRFPSENIQPTNFQTIGDMWLLFYQSCVNKAWDIDTNQQKTTCERLAAATIWSSHKMFFSHTIATIDWIPHWNESAGK